MSPQSGSFGPSRPRQKSLKKEMESQTEVRKKGNSRNVIRVYRKTKKKKNIDIK